MYYIENIEFFTPISPLAGFYLLSLNKEMHIRLRNPIVAPSRLENETPGFKNIRSSMKVTNMFEDPIAETIQALVSYLQASIMKV